jgi:hypothetical protein
MLSNVVTVDDDAAVRVWDSRRSVDRLESKLSDGERESKRWRGAPTATRRSVGRRPRCLTG